jgi:hypothetical protein
MLKNKLLTLAGVLAILACGACFMPPLSQNEPPPPPNRLASVHRITIDVEDGTGSNLFDPVAMSSVTVGEFDRLWAESPVRATVFNAGRPSDAVLKIVVLHKTASCTLQSNGKQLCSFEMISSFTLMAADGRILQSRPQESSKFGVWYQGDSLPGNLNANPFRQNAAYSLAMAAGDIFLLPLSSNSFSGDPSV